ncbi:tripartite tricarboxylate transporter substrate binding protein [Verminephrobacter eiseniae]|uniref:Bug family tripartite tricarboxylate transporter substrate binding protein n=1 Tax=Verminephrobacter eiseniae TaxID=364317 RepID=UPI0022377D66|nr:tripartite tricarboxylate transporter substrate binding protein [Verminephrobacter eiseniae]MCW5258958.1 tripartite tricarboxylate transporter substrate binding protein [Verminephrobacter eiseniae]
MAARSLRHLIGDATLGAGAALAADPYPSRPIKLIVPFAPGGPTDVMGRVVGRLLSERLKQPVVIENRAGAGGNLGTAAVANAPVDGYTIALSAVSSLAIAPALYPALPYNVKTDFTPITLVGIAKGAIVAHPSAPFDDLRGLVAYAKANPGKLAYASSGMGTTNHLAAESFQVAAGTQLVHVPYRSTGPATQDLLAGTVLLSFESSLTSAAPNVNAGRLKAIAITAATRSALPPDVPTVAEQGYPGFDVPTWFGIVAPANLHRAITEVLGTSEVAERFAQIGAEPTPMAAERFAGYIRAENERWAKVIRDPRITLE